MAEIRQGDPSCRSDQEALTVFGLLLFAASLSTFDDLRDAIVLKGGTVLRLLNDGRLNRRPTKDLDASLLREPDDFSRRIETEVVDRCNTLLRDMSDGPAEFDAVAEDRSGRRSIDADLYQFRLTLSVRPRGRRKPLIANEQKFRFEASRDEWIDPALLIDFPSTPVSMPITLCCYAPLQSLAEKLRAILQKRWHHESAQADGKPTSAGNFPPRHVLDIETLYHHCLADLTALPDLFARKCASKDGSIKSRKKPISVPAS